MASTNITTYHGEERRRAPRAPVCLPVAAECDAWAGLCFSKDISESGTFLICQRLPTPGSGYSVDLHLPGRIGRLRLGGTVVRVQGDHPRGFGLIWKSLTDDKMALLRSLWERWDTAFPSQQA